MYTVTLYPGNGQKVEYVGPKEYIVKKREEGIMQGWGTSGIKERGQ